ncbi:MAG: 50S ribosomal protein L3 [Firmicutes bacterium]|nr:50S ribosomal protein L3 [Bacillota bacterium]
MPKAILGTKLGMTQVFSPEGKIIPVTVVEAEPNRVAQVKTEENDGYKAIQLAYGAIKPVNVNKPLAGHCEKAGIEPLKYFKEVHVKDTDAYKAGDTVTVEIFNAGESVDVSGVSKGKGFAGGIKRWNQRRGPMGHGSKNHRRPASAGAKGPARIFKGTHRPGHMGTENVTVQNLEVVKVDAERNLLLIKGALPGPKHGLLLVKESRKQG